MSSTVHHSNQRPVSMKLESWVILAAVLATCVGASVLLALRARASAHDELDIRGTLGAVLVFFIITSMVAISILGHVAQKVQRSGMSKRTNQL